MDTAVAENLVWIGALAVVLAIAAIAARRTRRDLTRVAQSSLPPAPAIRCAQCGQPMEAGFVAVGGISWRAVDSPPRKVTGAGEKLANVAADQSMLAFSLGVPENRAHRCRACRLVLVDHSRLFVFERS